MAITAKKNIWFWGSSESGPMPIRTVQIAASQGILIPNSPMGTTSSGLRLALLDQETAVLGLLVGVVSKSTTWPLAAALAANAEVRVAIMRSGDIFAVYCENNTSDASVGVANIGGTNYAAQVDTGSGQVGYCSLDLNDSTHDLFKIIDIASNVEPQKYTTSDSPGVALVTICGTLLG